MSQAGQRPIRTYSRPPDSAWWLRRRSYFLYMVREFTVVPMVAWLIWFLYQVAALNRGKYEGPTTEDLAFIAFSIVCLFFALWHAITFLNLSGLILRVPVGDRFVPAAAIKALAFGGLLVVTAAGAAIMISLGTVRL